MPKRKPPRPTPERNLGRGQLGPTQRSLIASALPWMLMPGQVRLASREQQPRPPVIAVGKKRGKGR
jgi:hypothetical protein